MCGLFGVCSQNSLNADLAIESLNTLEHRGPDQSSYYSNSVVFMGHRRLSILDLSDAGKQPMRSGEVIISVNGEIYNFEALRSELEKKYSFRSNSDSEVVLHGYIEWGIDKLLEKIDGMYSLAIYNEKTGEVILARDRVGIKPLYYALIDGVFSWGSELKSLESYFGVNNLRFDETSFYDFLTYLYIPTPKTLYKNIYKLEPATYITFSIEEFTFSKNKYWELVVSENKITTAEARIKLKSLIDRSVSEQMISDVPVGFFLSGGVDSSVVVASAGLKNKKINTYTIGFNEEDKDERSFSKLVSDLFNTNHHERIMSDKDFSRLYSRLNEWFDEPFADTSAFPTYLVSEFAKQESTVVLTGDGGDEVFGGYNWYRTFEMMNSKASRKLMSSTKFLFNRLKPLLKKTILKKIISKLEFSYVLSDLELYTKLMGGLISNEKVKYRKLLGIPDDYDDYWYFRKFYVEKYPVITRLQYMDFHTYLPDDILTKVDRVSMSVSLECRVPLLSKEIIEFSFSLPEDVRLCNGELKGLFKNAFSDILPYEILYRKKQGFSIPLNSWSDVFDTRLLTKQELILKRFEQLL